MHAGRVQAHAVLPDSGSATTTTTTTTIQTAAGFTESIIIVIDPARPPRLLLQVPAFWNPSFVLFGPSAGAHPVLAPVCHILLVVQYFLLIVQATTE